MGNRGEWSRDLAARLGNTNPNASIIQWISAWTKGENTRATYNPLATMWDLPPNTEFNSVGVRNFETREQGLLATVKTLYGNHRGYSDIREGIRTNDAARAQSGLTASPWGTNAAHVLQIYQSGDVTQETLLSEPETTGSRSGGQWTNVYTRGGPVYEMNDTQQQYSDMRINAALDDIGVPSPSLSELTGTVTEDDAKRAVKGLSGVILVLFGVFFLVRNVLPKPATILKTVANG